MRTLSILVIFILLSCQSSKKSKISYQAKSNSFYKPFAEFNGDTLQYLTYNFVDHKEQYNGKKLNVLLNDLEMPVKSFRHSYRFNQNGVSTSLTLLLSSLGTKKKAKKNALSFYSLSVKWEKPLTKSEPVALYKKKDKGWNANWDNNLDSLEAFLGERNITNVGVTDHSNKDSVKVNPFYKPLVEFKGDTVQYLTYNFEIYAEQYQGEPFKALYRDLEIPVRFFDYGYFSGGPLYSGLELDFYSPYYSHPNGHTFATLHVKWKTRIPKDEILQWIKDSSRNWNESRVGLFSQRIISEVYVYACGQPALLTHKLSCSLAKKRLCLLYRKTNPLAPKHKCFHL